MSRTIDVSGLGARGVLVQGAAVGDDTGWSVSGAGDINGDGFDDIIIGAPYSDVGGTNAGSAYVIYGHAGGSVALDLANLSAAQGFVIDGSNLAGLSVSGAGDVNGDGFDDLIVATYARSQLGGYGLATAYVVFGKVAHAGPVDLGHLAASDGFSIGGAVESSYYQGYAMSVSSAGDVNGDGFDDVIVGARYAHGNTGAAYVVFGHASGNIDLNNLTATQGFAILGINPRDEAGTRVSGIGDINGDGFDDVIVGAPGADSGGSNAGAAYVIFGKAGGFGTVDLANLAEPTGFVIKGGAIYDSVGISVSGAGDVNGDGFDDFIVGAPFGNTGHAYVIFGKAAGFGTVDLANLGAGGFAIEGVGNGGELGFSVAGAGDVNHDGFDDVIVSAHTSDTGGQDAGGAYVIFGKASGFDTIHIANLPSTAGFFVQGGPGTLLGFSVAGAGDFDHDGFADLVLGAPFAPGGGQVVLVSSRAVLNAAANDFNGDGRSDVLWQNDDRTVRDWLGQSPNGNFVGNIDHVNFLGAAGSTMIGTGDFDGDGRVDTLWQTSDGRVTDLLGQPNGGFVDNYAKVGILTGTDWHAVAIGDFNNDSLDDVIWQNDNGTIREWLGQSDGTFAGNIDHVNFVARAGSHLIGSGDFNGDGFDDLLWQTADGLVTDLLGQAGGGFVDNYTRVAIFTGTDWHAIGTGDFNGDGRDDVLWRNDNGTIREWLGQSDGTFVGNTDHVNFVPAAGAHVIDIGDYNGDGIDDLLWSNNGTVTSSLGSSTGAFVDNSANVNIHTGTEWHAQAPFVHDSFA
jgi:hypothetical protein